jgi:hypothetical protein
VGVRKRGTDGKGATTGTTGKGDKGELGDKGETAGAGEMSIQSILFFVGYDVTT